MILLDGRVLQGAPSGVRDIAAGLVQGLREVEADGSIKLMIGGTSRDDRFDVRISARGFMEYGLPFAAIRKRADRILVPRQTVPIATPIPAVPLFHDIGFLQRPDLYPGARRIATTTRIAATRRRGLAVSEYTAAEMADRGLGHSISPLPIGAVHKVKWRPDPVDRYVLCVAAQEPHKNIPRLVEAWSRAETEDVRLVICGRRGQDSSNIDDALHRLPKPGSVEVVSALDDAAYSTLLENCWGYVQPSFYEGLCIPALDLAAAGAPVVVSSQSNLGRVFASGPPDLLFDPSSVSSLARSLSLLVGDHAFRTASSVFSQRTVLMTNWKTVALTAVEGMR